MADTDIRLRQAGKHTIARMIVIGILGISAAIPLMLIFSSLSAWLREAGIDRSTITFLSWAALGYSFKWIWAPLADNLSLPVIGKKLGMRRSWLLLAQIGIITALILMATADPANSLYVMTAAAILLGFSSATQDLIIDAFRIEFAPQEEQTLLAATYVSGYRVGMIVGGAGCLYLADFFADSSLSYDISAWRSAYLAMAVIMSIGILITLLVKEPETAQARKHQLTDLSDQKKFLLLFGVTLIGFIAVFTVSADLLAQAKAAIANLFIDLGAVEKFAQRLAGFIAGTCRLGLGLLGGYAVAALWLQFKLCDPQIASTAFLSPVKDFIHRYGKTALVILALIGFYRVSDIVMGVMANLFYLDLGFTKTDIATYSKFYGLLATLAGGFCAGYICIHFGIIRTLFLGALLSAASNILFAHAAMIGSGIDITYLAIVICSDSFCGGIATAAFVAFLSSLVNIQFTATQYAIFSSLMTLFPKILAGYSGAIVDTYGYINFFVGTAIIGIPILFLIIWVSYLTKTKS